VVRLDSLCKSLPYNAKRADAYKDAAFEALWLIRTHAAEIEAMARDAARLNWLLENVRTGSIGFGDWWINADEPADEWRHTIDVAMHDSAREDSNE